MSALKTLVAAAALMAVTAPAMAQNASPSDLRDRNAYVLDMQAPKSTVFSMNNGQLYMARPGMFDRAGDFMPGGL